jgi:MoxR-like ATPase
VPRPFVVIATQNDLEQLGTYRLPEAQLDRFLMKTSLGYASTESTVEILRNNARGVLPEDLSPVVSTADVQRMIEVVDSIHLQDSLLDYIVRLIEATRELPEVEVGSSPRGAIALMKAGRAIAAARGRVFVDLDDLRLAAPEVLAHRLVLTAEAEYSKTDARELITRVVDAVALPDLSRAG